MPNTETETYSLALIAEEIGEVMEIGGRLLQMLGKAGRFGIDTPGVKDPITGQVDMTITPRKKIAAECGDLMAAINYAIERGVLDRDIVWDTSGRKFLKLTDPNARDNLGRRLAP